MSGFPTAYNQWDKSMLLWLLSATLAPLAVPAVADTPSEILDAYRAATGGSTWNDKVTLQTEFVATGYGLTGTGHATVDLRDGRSERAYTLGPTTEAEGYDGLNRWRREMSGTVTLQQGGDGPELAVNDSYRASGKWWQPDRGGAEISGGRVETCGDATCEVLKVTPRKGKVFEAWFDRATGLLVKTIENRQPLTVTTTMSDYRRVEGVMLPFRVTVDTGLGDKYAQTLTLTAARFAGPMSDSVYGPPQVTLNDFSILDGRFQTVIPFRLINNHIYGTARINGRGPYAFLFDTGATNGITAGLAGKLGLEIVGQTPEFGAGSGVMEGGFTRVARLQVGQAELRSQVFSVDPLDEQEFVEGTPMSGLIGYEVFSRFVTRIDYAKDKITLLDAAHFNPREAGRPVHFVFHHHIPEVIGTFEGLSAKYSIDTGARFELMLTKSFVEQADLRTRHPHGIDAVYGWGVGGATRGYITRAARMTVGDNEVAEVVTNFSTQNRGGLSGSIGGGFLKRFVVTFDYGHQTIYLQPHAKPLPDTGTFDRAGMWFNQSPQGFEVVDVTPGTPAQQAGLEPGVIILAVDGVPARKLHLYAVRQKLRADPPGTVVTLRVKDGSSVTDVKVTLRDLV